MPSSTIPVITINLSSHPCKSPLGIILAPTKIDINHEEFPNYSPHDSNHTNSLNHTSNNKTTTTPTTNSKTHNTSSGPSNLMRMMMMDHQSGDNHHNFNPQNSTTIVLVGYTRHNHQMGPIQKSNLVRLGDVLVEINGVSVRKMSFRRVMDLLKCLVYGGTEQKQTNMNKIHNHDSSHKSVTLNSLSFEDGRVYYATHFHTNNLSSGDALSLLTSVVGGGGGGMEGNGGSRINNHSDVRRKNNQWNMAKENVLYSFSSWIQRARLRQEEEAPQLQEDGNSSLQVRFEPEFHINSFDDVTASANNDNDKNKPKGVYVQYEIKCVLKIKQNNQQEEETTWSIWKRYSEIKKLDEHIRKTFHWSMENIKYPSSNVLRSVFYGSKHSKFVQRRKNELEIYWNELSCNVDGLFDFGDPTSSHRYSYKMAEFLELKREYFQPRMVGTGGTSTAMSVSASSSKPNVIQVEDSGGMLIDESSLSMLSNSADGGGNNAVLGAPVVGGLTSATVSLSGQNSGANKSSCDKSVTSEGVVSTTGLGKKKKKRKKVVAKAAYHRRLMDDL